MGYICLIQELNTYRWVASIFFTAFVWLFPCIISSEYTIIGMFQGVILYYQQPNQSHLQGKQWYIYCPKVPATSLKQDII